MKVELLLDFGLRISLPSSVQPLTLARWTLCLGVQIDCPDGGVLNRRNGKNGNTKPEQPKVYVQKRKRAYRLRFQHRAPRNFGGLHNHPNLSAFSRTKTEKRNVL